VSGRIEGIVVEITSDGDLITDIAPESWNSIPRSTDTRILIDGEHETLGLFDSNHQQPSMTLIAIAEGEAPLKVHLVSDSASMLLGVRTGAPIDIRW